MTRPGLLLLILPAALAAGGVARAGGPEPRSGREGFAVGLGVGPSLFKGTGDLGSIQGGGGDFLFRLGTTATPDFLWMLEFEAGGELTNAGNQGHTTFNNLARLTLGGQYYLRQALWLRGGVGVASFAARLGGQNGAVDESSRRTGLAMAGGGGVDLFRRGRFTIDLELTLTAAVFSGSFLGHAAGMLGLAWY